MLIWKMNSAFSRICIFDKAIRGTENKKGRRNDEPFCSSSWT